LREHFSDLYEGSIDPGLGQQLKARLETDLDLKDDYDQFVTTMFMLGKMPEELIEVPSNLSSKISDRLAANPKKSALSLGAFWRNFGVGALACVAIVGSFVALNTRNTGPGRAGIVEGPAPFRDAVRKSLDSIEIKMLRNEATLIYDSSGPKTVTVVNVEDQKLVKKYDVDGSKSLKSSLVNTNEQPCAFQIEATGENMKHLVVVPGTANEFEAAGTGDLVAFAKVLATKYHKVIHLQITSDAKSNLQWDVSTPEAQDAATAVLSASEYTVTTSTDGILNIQSTW
jgi:hypothetical protein